MSASEAQFTESFAAPMAGTCHGKGELNWARLNEAILGTAGSSAMIFLIILGAGI